MITYCPKPSPYVAISKDGSKLWYFGALKDAKKYFKLIEDKDHQIKIVSIKKDNKFTMIKYDKYEINKVAD